MFVPLADGRGCKWSDRCADPVSVEISEIEPLIVASSCQSTWFSFDFGTLFTLPVVVASLLVWQILIHLLISRSRMANP